MRGTLKLFSMEAVVLLLTSAAMTIIRALVVMFAVNWTLAPWTDTRIDSWAALGITILLDQLHRTVTTCGTPRSA